MRTKLPNLTLGYHGCDKSTYEKVIFHHQPLKKSQNTYDWLGHGVYFWEHNYQRAMEFAKEKAKRKGDDVRNAAVIGAVIDLGYCLNLTDTYSLDLLRQAYKGCKEYNFLTGKKMPENKNIGESSDYLLRALDCAVVEFLHQQLRALGKEPFDSVRGVFVEGKALYPNSGFREKTHIQLCVINPKCIRGYFSPID